MGFQVKFLCLLARGAFLLLLFSCQSNRGTPTFSKQNDHLSDVQNQSLDAESEQLSEKLRALDLESEWLSLRKLIVDAETRSCVVRQSELKLKSDYEKFKALNHRFPSEQGFITESKRMEWEARIKVRMEETNKHRARVRLLNRDMKDLEAKLYRKGYRFELLNSSMKVKTDEG